MQSMNEYLKYAFIIKKYAEKNTQKDYYFYYPNNEECFKNYKKCHVVNEKNNDYIESK